LLRPLPIVLQFFIPLDKAFPRYPL
jgi:hypothetical protein